MTDENGWLISIWDSICAEGSTSKLSDNLENQLISKVTLHHSLLPSSNLTQLYRMKALIRCHDLKQVVSSSGE